MLRFSKRGYVLFRYVVGLFYTREGFPVRLGVPGVSDLVGYRPHVVTQEDVGKTLAVLTTVEVKYGRGGLRPEQHDFLQAVTDAGGEAWVTRDDTDERYAGRAQGRKDAGDAQPGAGDSK